MPSFSESQWSTIKDRHAAEVDRLRETLSQQQSWIAMLEADLAQVAERERVALADAAKWQVRAANNETINNVFGRIDAKILGEIRYVLGTRKDDDIMAHAAQVAADAAKWRAVPVAQIKRWAYGSQTADDERVITAWVQEMDV